MWAECCSAFAEFFRPRLMLVPAVMQQADGTSARAHLLSIFRTWARQEGGGCSDHILALLGIALAMLIRSSRESKACDASLADAGLANTGWPWSVLFMGNVEFRGGRDRALRGGMFFNFLSRGHSWREEKVRFGAADWRVDGRQQRCGGSGVPADVRADRPLFLIWVSRSGDGAADDCWPNSRRGGRNPAERWRRHACLGAIRLAAWRRRSALSSRR